MQSTRHKPFTANKSIRIAVKTDDAVQAIKNWLSFKPPTLAVCLQVIALMLVTYICRYVALSGLQLVLLQACIATVLSLVMGMATWWRYIHFCFPLALYFCADLPIPEEFYLVSFVFTLALFWTTFRSQVPFFPSFPSVWKQVADLLPVAKSVKLIDIGSGLGDMPMYISKVRPNSLVEGIEVAPLPWAISYFRAKMAGSRVTFKLGDYKALNFAEYDVVFAYLSPVAMLDLWTKAKDEMRPGSILISLAFEVPGVQPSMQLKANENSPSLYVWRFS